MKPQTQSSRPAASGLTLLVGVLAGLVVFYFLLEQAWQLEFLLHSVRSFDGSSQAFDQPGSWSRFLVRCLRQVPGLFKVCWLLLNAAFLGELLLKTPLLASVNRPGLCFPLGIVVYALAVFLGGSLLGVSTTGFVIGGNLPLLLRLLLVSRFPLRLVDYLPVASIRQHPVLCLWLLVAFVPLWLQSSTPPIHYDALEYHLGAAREYWQLGHIQFLPHNLYANMPSLGTMLNLVLISWNAGAFAKVLQALCILLAALVLLQQVKGPWGFVVATAFMVLPEWILSVATALNEPMITLLALWVFYLALAGRSRAEGFLTGLFLGGLLCLKYAAAVVVLPPVLVWLLWQRRVAMLLPLAAGMGLVFSPFALRNALASGNPLYPFFGFLFSRFIPEGTPSLAHFTQLHFAKGFSPAALCQAVSGLWNRMESNTVGLVTLSLSAFWFLCRQEAGRIRGLVFLLLGVFGMWLAVTHQVPRFYYLSLPLQLWLGARLMAAGNTWLRRLVRGAFLMQIVYGFLFFAYYFQAIPAARLYTGAISQDEFILHYAAPYVQNILFRQRPDYQPHVLQIADARVYYCHWPVVYSTPYLEPEYLRYFKNGRLRLERLREDGINGIYINLSELERVRPKFPRPVAMSDAQIVAALEKDAVKVYQHPTGQDRFYILKK